METKRCCTCKTVLPLAAFNVRSAASDGLQSRCRDCCRRWYEANREAHIQHVRVRNVRARAALYVLVGEYFRSHPCVDCGESDVRCLEFDHRDPIDKLSEVNILLKNVRSWAVVLREIEKCDVRCANCHRRWTAMQVNSWRHQLHLRGHLASEAQSPREA